MSIGRVVWIDYTTHESLGLVARLSCRMESGERRDCYVTDIEPWFFAPSEEEVPDSDHIVRVEDGYESIFNSSVSKIIVDHPYAVSGVRDYPNLSSHFSETFEGDIPLYRKLSIVDGLSGHIVLPEKQEEGIEVISYNDIVTDSGDVEPVESRVLIADIEVKVSDEESFNDTVENGSQPIICISTYDTFEDEYHLFYYDKHDSLHEPSQIREFIVDHWDSGEESDVDISLHIADSEEEMMVEFIEYVRDISPDLFTGYNFVSFDAEYIINRCGVLDDVSLANASPFGSLDWTRNPRMKICGIPTWDMMKMYAEKFTYGEWRSKSLDYVANEELDAGKVEDVNINQAWEDNPEKLLAYNLIDTQLCKLLNEQSGLYAFYYDLAEQCSVPIVDVMYEKRLIDGYLISRRGSDEILPTAEEAEIPNAGGYVLDPIDGRKEDIGAIDLASLYPSCILQFNLSSETIAEEPKEFDEYVKIPHVPEPKNVSDEIREEDIEWDWLYASLDEEGLIPRNIKKLFKERDYAKEQRSQYEKGTRGYERWNRTQRSIKEVMNSFYGNSGSPYWRLSRKELAEAITSTARYALWKGIDYARKNDIPLVYGDTDSILFSLEEDEIKEQVDELEGIASDINSHMSTVADDIDIEGEHPYLTGDLHGTKRTTLKYDAEYVYETFMQLGRKKRYCGSIKWEEGTTFDEPDTKISGFEFQRSDSMRITAELQEQIIEMILAGDGFDEVSEYIQSVIDRIDTDSDNVKDFALPGSINKPLEEYPNRQIPRACLWSNEYLDKEFGDGDDPFVYLVNSTPGGLPKTDVLALEWNDEIPDGFELDKEAIIERAIRKPISSIIEEMGWTFDEIRSGRHVDESAIDLSGDGSNPFT